jgi:hypothetical protein
MKSFTKNMFVLTAVAAAAFALVVCGGGECGRGGGGTTGATSAPDISAGTMPKGSVILNGIRFEEARGTCSSGTLTAGEGEIE